MKKSYHSMVVPIVDAMTALRRFALWSDADRVPYVVVVAIGVPPGVSSAPRKRALTVGFCRQDYWSPSIAQTVGLAQSGPPGRELINRPALESRRVVASPASLLATADEVIE